MSLLQSITTLIFMLLRDVKLIMHAIKTDTDIEATPALLLKKRATARVHQLNQVDQGQYSSRVTTPVKSVRLIHLLNINNNKIKIKNRPR